MITLKEDRLIIEGYAVEDPDIVRFFLDIESDEEEGVQAEYETALLRALKVGVVALERAQTRVDIDMIRREFDLWQGQMQEALDAVFKEDQGRMALALCDYLGEGGKLQDLFDPDRKDSAIGRIQAIFDEHFGGDGAKFARLLDYTEANSPLKKLHQAFEKQFKDVDDKLSNLEQALAAEKARLVEHELGTQKGLDFEEQLVHILNEVAKPFGDCVQHVGMKPIAGGGKKGDVLVELNEKDTDGQRALILIEAKRASRPVTGKTGILEEMTKAAASRGAHFSIAVFSDDVCPSEAGPIRVYPENRVVCSVAPDGSQSLALEVAYGLARSELCWQLRHSTQAVDRARVAEAVGHASEKLSQFTGLKQNATQLVKTAQEIRDQLDDIEREIRSALKDILADMDSSDEAHGS